MQWEQKEISFYLFQNKVKEPIISKKWNYEFDKEEVSLMWQNAGLIRFIAQVKCIFRQNSSAHILWPKDNLIHDKN